VETQNVAQFRTGWLGPLNKLAFQGCSGVRTGGKTNVTSEVEQVALVEMSPLWRNPILVMGKRGLDVVLSAVLLVLVLPLFLVLAVLIKMTSRGPVFYRWRVVGQDGQRIIGYKLRSMCANADEIKHQLEPFNEMNGPVFKLTNDPRVTKLGRWMRRHSLDELPQLYSVLKGDMSLVGPRPPLFSEYSHFNDYQKQKLAVKPGMTCLWQVNGRNEVKDFDEWVRMDLRYIRDWSPALDLHILIKTIGAVFTGSGK
jgi:lipopolysaccharide/colanic/teichoic acid biosynthesis glycosyltransferase